MINLNKKPKQKSIVSNKRLFDNQQYSLY